MADAYGHAHRATRETYRPDVEAGLARCAEIICLKRTRWISPTEPWDLAHDRATGGYLGPAHEQCNRSEGATYGNDKRKSRRRWVL